jgi:hypothetical protein
MTKLFFTTLLSMSVIGCASPVIKYEADPPSGSTGYPFQLAETIVTFAFPEEGTGIAKGVNTSKLVITSVPTPIEGRTYSISGTGASENWGVKTELNVTHRNDTMLLQEIGSSVTDTRKQLIADVSSAVVGIIGIFAQTNTPADTKEGAVVPVGISITKLLETSKCTPRGSVISGQDSMGGIVDCEVTLEGGGITDSAKVVTPYLAKITIGARPSRALKLSELTFPYKSDSLMYSACRSMSIEVTNKANPNLAGSASLRIADQGWVELVKFPEKGKITLGASCGADVVSQDAVLPTAMDYVNASLSSAKSIKDALDKKSSSGTK